DHVITPSTAASYNRSTVLPGHTVGFRGDLGQYLPFTINGINTVSNRTELGVSKGLGREVLLTNIDGNMVLSNTTSHSYGMKGLNNNYLRFIGQGTKEDPYGIKFKDLQKGIAIQFQYNNYEGFEFAFIEISGCSSIGISFKNEL